MKYQIALGVATLAAVMSMAASAANTAMRTENSSNPDTCVARLPPRQRPFEQNIGSGLRLIFRETKYLLVYAANQRDRCGTNKEMTVLSTLEIPTVRSDQWHGASFDCAAPANTVTRGKPFIGIFATADNAAKTKALRGWTVDFRSKKFVPVDGAVCYSFDR